LWCVLAVPMSTIEVLREETEVSSALPVAWTPTPPPKFVEPPRISTLADQVANDFIWSYANAATRQNYIQGLKAWFSFCVSIGIDPLTGIEGNGVRRADIEKFLRYEEDVRGHARRTVAGYYSAIKGFFLRARCDGHIDKDPCEFVKAPVVERKTTTNDMTRRQYGRILDIAEKRSARDFAIFSILGQNGFRASELVGIDIEDLGNDRGWTTATIHRKGGKTETQTFSMQTAYAVNRHLAEMAEQGITGGPLFRSKRNPERRMKRADLQALVKRYARWASIQQRISPHSFRHFFVTQCRDAGINDREIQAATGHADLRMVTYYDHGNTTKGREATHGMSTFVAEMRGD
jgi:integrase/recombinase XerD